MKFVSYLFFRLLIGLFALIPFPLLYFISDLLRIFFKYVLRYRVHVINQNLAYCFPDKTEEERKIIASAFYKNFIDILLESIKGLATKPEKLIPRYKFRNAEVMDDAYNSGSNIIIYSQHYNNWEWAPLCLGLQMKHHLVGVVKFLSNPYINKYMISGRSGNNVSVIPTYNTAKYFKQLHKVERPVGIVFIADQKPSGSEKNIELDFLGSKARFHQGAGNYVANSGLATYTFDIRRVKRGYYEAEVKELLPPGHKLSSPQVTEIYKQNLEKLILESPHSWLWSHKRFKQYLEY